LALYCSTDVMAALDGVAFPATKHDLIEYAEMNDASEAVLVVLNSLDEDNSIDDVGEVCRNAQITCRHDIAGILIGAPFPATKDGLVSYANEIGASSLVRGALESLPSGYTYRTIDEVCEYVL